MYAPRARKRTTGDAPTVHHLWQGNSHEAERCRRQLNMARVQSSAAQSFESVQLTWQLIAHVAMEDLTRIKDSLAEVAPLAARFPEFQVVLKYGDAEYQRIRGDSGSALAILEGVLPMCEAGTHQIWPQLAAALVVGFVAVPLRPELHASRNTAPCGLSSSSGFRDVSGWAPNSAALRVPLRAATQQLRSRGVCPTKATAHDFSLMTSWHWW